MEITETLYVATRKDWRAWLKTHHKTKKEIWLVYYNKKSGKPRIAYNDAVEEALCFGWIDSTVKKIDGDRFAQRFSRRNPKSGYSQLNMERLRKLLRQGKVIKEVKDKVSVILEQEEWEIPAGILSAIQANENAWKHFQKFSEPYKRVRVAYIASAEKRPEEFEKRLNYFIKKTAQNKQFGYDGIEQIIAQKSR